MGTNYYAFSRIKCNCGATHETEHLHIGKSSIGWYFSLHSIPEENLTSLQLWQQYLRLECTVIEDEYGTEISLEELLRVIEKRAHAKPSDDFDFIGNCAEPGINNLVRSKVDGLRCLSHGDGPYSLFAGEFC